MPDCGRLYVILRDLQKNIASRLRMVFPHHPSSGSERTTTALYADASGARRRTQETDRAWSDDEIRSVVASITAVPNTNVLQTVGASGTRGICGIHYLTSALPLGALQPDASQLTVLMVTKPAMFRTDNCTEELSTINPGISLVPGDELPFVFGDRNNFQWF